MTSRTSLAIWKKMILMSDPSSNKPEDQSAVPVPYSVLALGWIVSGIASNVVAPPLAPIVWMAGPCIMAYKFKKDGDRFAAKKDNPAPKLYSVPKEVVFHAFDQAIETLPGYFENVSIKRGYQNIHPQSGLPMHIERTVYLDHPEIDRKQLTGSQKPTSDLFIRCYISEDGKQTNLSLQYTCRPLITRGGLDPIIEHIQTLIDQIVEQHKK